MITLKSKVSLPETQRFKIVSIRWRYVNGKKELPEGFFGPPAERGEDWPDEPNVRRAVEWFIALMSHEEWEKRRRRVAEYFYSTPQEKVEADKSGRYFDDSDTFAWHLFQAEAFIDYKWHYEPTFGSRVVPVFSAIGRRLDHLKSVGNVEDRARRVYTSERSQPNGALFELLVASKYAEIGATVAFRPEEPGLAKTHDMDVHFLGNHYAVECKRMEIGQYAEKEREMARSLWRPALDILLPTRLSTFCNVGFKETLERVPDDYLAERTVELLLSGQDNLVWNDEIAAGSIGRPDLRELESVLEADDILIDGTRFHELVTGQYLRNANTILSTLARCRQSPRLISECNQVVMLRWSCHAEESIERKARDIVRHLSKANTQFPEGVRCIVHIGFEAVDEDFIEIRRLEKISAAISHFNSSPKHLCRVYCHWFSPESPPNEAWAFDETVHWYNLVPDVDPRLSEAMFVVIPDDISTRKGVHWRSG